MTGGSPNIAPSEPAFRGPGSSAQTERTPTGARRSAGERALRRWRRSCQPRRCFHVASGGRVGSGSDGTHLCPRRPPRRNAHPRLPAASRQAGDAALHRPPLRPFQRPPAGGRPLARGIRKSAEHCPCKPWRPRGRHRESYGRRCGVHKAVRGSNGACTGQRTAAAACTGSEGRPRRAALPQLRQGPRLPSGVF